MWFSGGKKSGVIMFLGLHGALRRIGESDQTSEGEYGAVGQYPYQE